MGDHRNVIEENFVYLCNYTNCTLRLLDISTAMKILTPDERVEIERQPEGYDRSRAFYKVLLRKDWGDFTEVVSIMEDQDTKQSDSVLSILKIFKKAKKENIPFFNSRWWPEEKTLEKPIYERKIKQCLLVEELFKILTEQGNQAAVISQKVTDSGFGGVGKTTTAKWYAKHYEEKYDNIIWIDCGERSLIKSFNQLRVDLQVQANCDSDLKDMASTCYQILEDKKCLIIFDNAEGYFCSNGIKDVLPKNEKFHSIITSRNRDWGIDTLDLQIKQLPLDVFTTEESVSFLGEKLEQKSIQQQHLKHLCDLLGNHPLALRIATSTLNKHIFEFADYIKRIETGGKKFENHEKAINTTLKTSLEYVQSRFKDLACSILLVFGYVLPDNIPISFLQAVESSRESYEIQAAMELFKIGSLVSIKRINNDKETDSYSVNRFLQQVIRRYNENNKEETLRKILSCKGHTENKIQPYTYAAESLQQEFPQLRDEFLDYQLSDLILSGQFDKACRLSESVYKHLQTYTSRFNHAICLKNCKLFDASLDHLSELFSNASNSREYILSESGLLSVGSEPSKVMVGSQMFIIHMLKGDIAKAKKIFEQIPNIDLPNTCETLRCLTLAFNSKRFEDSGLLKWFTSKRVH